MAVKEPAWTVKTLGSGFWFHLLASLSLFSPFCLFLLKKEITEALFCFVVVGVFFVVILTGFMAAGIVLVVKVLKVNLFF